MVLKMEPQVLGDAFKIEKDRANARFNCFRRIARLRQIIEVLVVLGLISWSSARAQAVGRAAACVAVRFSSYLYNDHVVFLIGNAIIVLLFVLFRYKDAASVPGGGGGGDFFDDYVNHAEATPHCPLSLSEAEAVPSCEATPHYPLSPPEAETKPSVEEKQIVVCAQEAVPQCDDVSVAIQEATRQIKKFQRTQSEKLRQEIAGRGKAELRRSETRVGRRRDGFDAAEIERLSSEEFRRAVDAFIAKHRSGKDMNRRHLEEHGKLQYLKVA